MKWLGLILLFLSGVSMGKTVDDVVKQYGPAAEKNFKDMFAKQRMAYPPKKIAFLAFKKEKLFELWAENDGKWRFVHAYQMTAASGMAGPKLREGDLQVPEGLYRITVLNPNSSYHLSMRLNYPNAFDQAKGKWDKREHLGGDIYIHGRDVSIGCIALGDEAIEGLFYLVHKMGRDNVDVVIAPMDFRLPGELPQVRYNPPWLTELYTGIKKELARFPIH